MTTSALPSLKQALRSAKQWVRYSTLPVSTPERPLQSKTKATATCVISADDPGGLGDAVMLRAITDHYGASELDVTCWRYPAAAAFPHTRNKLDVSLLKSKGTAERTLNQYGRLLCVGADVMDGLYAYADSCLRLRLLGLAAGMGLESRLLGFSFNATPHPKTRLEFEKLHKDVVVCVRDPISLERLAAITKHELRLVADMAFLVKPTALQPRVQSIVEWIDTQRAQGRKVIGLNLHPMFSFDHGHGITAALTKAFGALIESRQDVAYVLIPHDFRPTFGDVPTLQAVLNSVSASAQSQVRLVTDIHDPGELKAFVGHLDGVLTGRMHLAIAAMGRGVPVAGVTYQGKFEGLLRHFSLGEGLTLSPPEAADTTKLSAFFGQWYRQLEHESGTIQAHLPKVMALSRSNFD